jgi:Cu+-exporting ATPase
MFLRNIQTVTQLQDINHIVFDKTGTLTDPNKDVIEYHGRQLTERQKVSLSVLALQSQHPMSRAVRESLPGRNEDITCENFEEYPGQGIKGRVDGCEIRLGSAAFILGEKAFETGVWVEIDGQYQGHFSFETAIRQGTKEIVDRLNSNHTLHILSGDGEHDRERLEEVFPANTPMYFQQSPADKLAYIQNLQASKGRVLFIGDGLNDAGALRQADVGIVVSHSSQQFSPSSDVILDSTCWPSFSKYFEFIRNSKSLLYIAFIFAGLYNLIGLFFAVQGLLSPVVAAVLMPLSSISIILLGFAGSYGLSYFYFRNPRK